MDFMGPSGYPDTQRTISTDKDYGGLGFGTVKFIAILLTALVLSAPPIQAQNVSSPASAHVAQSSESRQVWVNTATGVYHSRHPMVRQYQAGQVYERGRGSPPRPNARK